MSTLIFKGDNTETKTDGSLTPEDMDLLRDMFTKKDE
jgi:hypothetical protein